MNVIAGLALVALAILVGVPSTAEGRHISDSRAHYLEKSRDLAVHRARVYRADMFQARKRVQELERAIREGDLATQVGAVAAMDDMQTLARVVLYPALQNWPCRGTVFQGQTFWSFDFSLRTPRGRCY